MTPPLAGSVAAKIALIALWLCFLATLAGAYFRFFGKAWD